MDPRLVLFLAMKRQSLQSSSSSSKTCNQSLWNFIAKAPGRFKIIKQCVTVTGTVLSINREPDGDTDFPLALDPQRYLRTYCIEFTFRFHLWFGFFAFRVLTFQLGMKVLLLLMW